MIRVVPKRQQEARHTMDCNRLVEVFADRSYELSITDAEIIWIEYSDSFAAGWLGLPADDD